jgi:hypothetical protein
MATVTSRLQLRKPAPTDTVNVETALNENYDTIDAEIGLGIGSTFPSNPYTGKLFYRTDQVRIYFYTGVDWKEIQLAANLPTNIAPAYTSNSTSQTNMTATSYTVTNPVVDVTFTVPATGKVYVTITSGLEASAGQTGFISFELRNDNSSGAQVLAANDDRAVAQQDSFNHQGSTRCLVTGLTPGATLYGRLMYRTTGGFMETFYNSLLVEPVIA